MKISFENVEKFLIFLTFLSFAVMDGKVVLFDIPMYLPEWLVLAALSLYIVRFLKKDIRITPVPFQFLFAAMLMLFGAILSSAMNGMDLEALGALKSWFFFPMLFSWLIFQSDFSEKDSWKAMSCWFFGVLSVAVAALLFPSFSVETYDGRLRSIFPSPNHFGFFLEYGAVLGIGLIIFLKKNRIALVVLTLFEAVIVSALLMTESSGALLSASVGAFVLFTTSALPAKISKKIIGLAVISMTLFLFSFLLSMEYDLLGDGTVRSSFSSRIMIWNASARMIAEQPFLGIGLRNFQEEYLALQPEFPPYLEWAVPHPHNIFLAFWLSTGVIGLAGFLLVLVFLFRNAVRSAFPSKGSASTLSGPLLALLVSLCLHGMVDTPYFKNDLAYVFWAIVALILIPRNKKDAEASKKIYKP